MTLSANAPRSVRSIRFTALVTVLGAAILISLTSCATSRPGAASSETPSAPSPTTSPAQTPATPLPTATDASSPQPTLQPSDITIITLEARDGKVEASGIVSGVVESGGVCTLALTREDKSVAATTEAVGGRESTYCGLLSVDDSSLSAGTWTAVVTYTSATRTAVSAPSSVDVP